MTGTLEQRRLAHDDDEAFPQVRVNLIFVTVVVAVFLSALDQTIVSTALPTIAGDLGGIGHMTWVVTAYMIAETIASLLAGRFGSMFGRKRVFLISTALFVGASLGCGLVTSMSALIAMRGVQGFGAGALLVTSTTLIGEALPLRRRAACQGALGAVFGLSTVVGPLLGGLFTDHLSWRWAFDVNVPIGIGLLALGARALPANGRKVTCSIDYLGAVLVAAAASGLILAASWGGTRYAWGSPIIVLLLLGSVAALAIFVRVELRAAEPILPMRLFRGRVFFCATLLSFIVGFACIGSITFLPSYLQYVRGTTATLSGVRTLPIVLGLIATALLSGQIVSRTGRYRPFPIAGSALMALGLYLMSRLTERTPEWQEALAMLVFGAGIGLIMQVLVLVVQNAAEYRDLGPATSAVTFFRTMGGAFGASIFGTLFAGALTTRLPGAAPSDPAAVRRLSGPGRELIAHAYAGAVHVVFFSAAPIALVAVLLAVLLPQVRMRSLAAQTATATDAGRRAAGQSRLDGPTRERRQPPAAQARRRRRGLRALRLPTRRCHGVGAASGIPARPARRTSDPAGRYRSGSRPSGRRPRNVLRRHRQRRLVAAARR